MSISDANFIKTWRPKNALAGNHPVVSFPHVTYSCVQQHASLLLVIFLHYAFLEGPPSISMPVLVRAFPGNEVMCLVTGSPPIHTVILNDSILLVNTTNTASFKFLKEGNYSCLATNKYGSVLRVFTVLGKSLTKGRWSPQRHQWSK